MSVHHQVGRLGALAARLFYRLELAGTRPPAEGPLLVVANHPNSLLDPALVNAGYGDVSSINSTAFGDVAQNIANGSCPLTHQASFFEGFLTGADATVAEDGDVWAFLTPPISADDDQAVTGGGEFVEVQGTAEQTPFRRDELDALLDLAVAGCAELARLQNEALGG